MPNFDLPTPLDTQRVMDAIHHTITPFVGATMAQASTRRLSEKLGIWGPAMSAEQAAALIEKVGQGLNIFVGHQRADQVQQEIRRVLRGDTGP